MRVALVMALLIAGLVIGAVLFAGSRPRVPLPFGLAANGQIVFIDQAGAIRAGDPVDGTSSIIVGGSGNRLPAMSPDGTRLAYLSVNDLLVVDPMGRDPVLVATDGLVGADYLVWTPDSSGLVVRQSTGMLVTYDVAADARPMLLLDSANVGGLHNDLADVFRPPAGDEILEVRTGPQGSGLYRRPLDGGVPIAVLTAETTSVPFSNLAGPQWSPDGSQIVFTLHPPESLDLGRAYIVNVDGTGLRRLSTFESQGAIVDEEHVTWSPDGTRVAFLRWVQDDDGVDVRPVTIVEVATGDEWEVGNVNVNGYASFAWSPDGRSIVQIPGESSPDRNRVLLIDAKTGELTKTDWMSSAASWQRTAP
jgi:Tol biopolymer transport system component